MKTAGKKTEYFKKDLKFIQEGSTAFTIKNPMQIESIKTKASIKPSEIPEINELVYLYWDFRCFSNTFALILEIISLYSIKEKSGIVYCYT